MLSFVLSGKKRREDSSFRCPFVDFVNRWTGNAGMRGSVVMDRCFLLARDLVRILILLGFLVVDCWLHIVKLV